MSTRAISTTFFSFFAGMFSHFETHFLWVIYLYLNSLTGLKDNNKYFVIDFDSTFTQVEALDELVKISLAGQENAEKVQAEIKDITELAMSGQLSFAESLRFQSLLSRNRTGWPLGKSI